MLKQNIGRYATELLTKCLIITDEMEKSQGARYDKFGNPIPLNSRNTYVYDSSNELKSEEDKGRLITKSGSIDVPNLTQDRITRERAAQLARSKYLTDLGNKQKPISKVYLPGDEEKIERSRNGDSEMISLMKELVEQNKSLSSEIQTLKSQVNGNQLTKIYKSPKSLRRGR